jgi:hypothetical protein
MAVDDIPTLETFTEGDTKAVVYGAAVDRNGAALSLTGKTLTLEGRKRDAAAAFTPIAVTVTDAAAGEWEADVAATMTTAAGSAGQYRCQVRITEGGTFFRSDPFKIPVRAPASAGTT